MTAIATAEQLRRRLQRPDPFSAEEIASAEDLLEDITGMIQDMIPGGVLEVEGAEFEARVHAWAILLPHAPKVPVEVTAVEVDGEALTADDWEVNRLHEVRREDGRPWSGKVLITYTYGWPAEIIPAGLRNIVLDLAARRFPNPESVLQMRMGADRSVSFADSSEGAAGLTAQQQRVLDSYMPAAVA